MPVYLIHFERPLHHARHYMGWTNNLDARIAEHANGDGAKLMAAIRKAGIGFEVVRTWDGDRHLERRLKNQKMAPRLCPVCRQLRNLSKTRQEDIDE